MSRRIYDDESLAHFVTFSCYKRRRLLDHDAPKKSVLSILAAQLEQQSGRCFGFVIMPDHVHATVWFPASNQLSHFMKQWKQRSSVKIKRLLASTLEEYAENVQPGDPVWQRKYYPFHIYSERKLREKLEYMHLNPVRAGLVETIVEWPWSSARYYELGKPVGVPLSWID